MTTQQIRFFLETAKCLNFTESARRMFVSQPTLSKQIALLESELGIKLFSRSNRSVSLTPAGTLLRSELEKVETGLLTAIDHARRLEQASDGNLAVGILDVINPAMFAADTIQRFRSCYPNVNLDVAIMGFAELKEHLLNGRLDLIFTKEFNLFDTEGLESVPIYPVTPCLLVPDSNPLSKEHMLTVSQLKEEKFIVLELGECSPHIQTLVDLCGRAGFYPKIAKYANSNMTRIFYVSEGYGITLMDGELPIPAWAKVSSIPVKPPSTDTFQANNVALAWRKSTTNPTCALFISSVRAHMQELGLVPQDHL